MKTTLQTRLDKARKRLATARNERDKQDGLIKATLQTIAEIKREAQDVGEDIR